MSKRLLLVSNSYVHGMGYLDHCAEAIVKLFGGCGNVLFVPFALHDWDGYAAKVQARFAPMGIPLHSIHRAKNHLDAVNDASGIFIGGGNTFRLLRTLQAWDDLRRLIRGRVLAGIPYLGTSAGANVACPTIKTTNDMPIVWPSSLDALELLKFQINPHFIHADPNSKHMGETRETRIKEFHEENDTPVIGLPEGTGLRVEDDNVHLETWVPGLKGPVVFRKGRDPLEIPADVGSSLLTDVLSNK